MEITYIYMEKHIYIEKLSKIHPNLFSCSHGWILFVTKKNSAGHFSINLTHLLININY